MTEEKESEKLPYKLSSLQWDAAHHFNTQVLHMPLPLCMLYLPLPQVY